MKIELKNEIMKNPFSKKSFTQLNKNEMLEVLEKLSENFEHPTNEYFQGVTDGINKIYRLIRDGWGIDFTKLSDKNYISKITD